MSDNLGYPKKSYDQNIEGKVHISFIVEKDGSIKNTKVFKGINEELNKEALRVVKYMPKWNPGKQDGEPINVKYTIPISFRINR